jgi:hypothetical protein
MPKVDEFVSDLETLMDLTGIEKHTAFAEFLGVTYMTYCNWRNHKNVASINFHKYAIEAYLRLPERELRALVRERIGE